MFLNPHPPASENRANDRTHTLASMSSVRRPRGTGPSSSPSSPDNVTDRPRLLPVERANARPAHDAP
jgi:hypothetical protein